MTLTFAIANYHPMGQRVGATSTRAAFDPLVCPGRWFQSQVGLSFPARQQENSELEENPTGWLWPCLLEEHLDKELKHLRQA